MSISELGKDTLKTLSDLRKAITEDTSKVADGTRQTVTAVASALALGLGLVAARLTTDTAPWLIFVVMVVIALYVAAIIYSGYDFIRLQRQLRTDWQPRLYRFLSVSDYERMVTKPARHAERTFISSAIIGGVAVLALTLALGYSWLFDSDRSRQTNLSPSGSVNDKATVSGTNTSPKGPRSQALYRRIPQLLSLQKNQPQASERTQRRLHTPRLRITVNDLPLRSPNFLGA